MHTKAIVLFFATLLVAGANLYAQDDRSFEIAKGIEEFTAVYKAVNREYVDDIDAGKMVRTAIDAMLKSLDPYTVYYPESDMEDVKMQLMGEYGGVGALIMQRGDSIMISECYEGLPADEAGIKAGDLILFVDGQSTKGKKTSDVSAAMRGQAGTTVLLTMERAGKKMEFSVRRREIKLPNVPYSGMVSPEVGYIKLDEFTTDAAKNVREAFLNLKSNNQNMKGIILDLRGNGGGLMNEAVDIVNIFVPRGTLVVETKGKVARKNIRSVTRNNPDDTEIKVAVLIDNGSASASEIVSGALQDLDRAVIIGQRSYGKGLVQNIVPIAYGSQMKVTVSKYYIPSGRCIQAIDYAKRDERGRAMRVPDSLKKSFTTAKGRTVYDGFGIEPDIEVEPEYMSLIGISIVQKGIIFDYATDYQRSHPSIPSPTTFEITDQIWDDFCAYIKNKHLEYTTATEHLIKQLEEAAKEEHYNEALASEIAALHEKLTLQKAHDLDLHRAEICEMLKAEILMRYYYDKGRIEGELGADKVVITAIETLTK